MAHPSSPVAQSTPILDRGRAILARIGRTLVEIGESGAQARQAKALMAMTDSELADRGLRRDQIARSVFGDSHWM